MNHLIHLGDGVFRWVAQTTWQAAVLAMMILLAQGLLRKRLSPGWRYGLWLLLVARLLMPGTPPSAFSIFNLAPPAPKHVFTASSWPTRIGSGSSFDVNYFNGTPQMPVPNVIEQPEDTIFQRRLRVMVKPGVREIVRPDPVSKKIEPPNILFWGWLAGVCFFGARLLWTNARFRSRLNDYQPVADENVTSLFSECRTAFNITHPVRLIESDEVESPAVYGLWRKCLLLPDGIFERFSSEELRHIFLHELAHIKRRDIEVNWLTTLLQILHWFNPVLWLAFARMRADRELATDALALAHVAGTENVSYGETILKVVENLAHPAVQPGLVGIAESKAGITERLRAIARCRTTRPWRWAAIGIAAIVALVGLTGAQQSHQPAANGKNGVAATSGDSAPMENRVPHISQQTTQPAEASKHEAVEISGIIVDAGGQPVSGVQVALVKLDYKVSAGIGLSQLFDPQFSHLFGETRLANLPWRYCTTDAQGRFYLNDLAGALHLVAANERGFAEIATNQFSTNMTITLEPWGRIEGTFRIYDRAVSYVWVSLGYTFNTIYHLVRKTDPQLAEKMPTVWYPDGPNVTSGTTFKTITDDHGHYSLDYVRPGQYEVFGPGVRERTAINPNETTIKDIGGHGRPVIGKFKIRNPYIQINWETVNERRQASGFCYFCTEPPMPAKPFKSRQDYLVWRKQRDVDRTLDNNGHGHYVQMAKDGSFRVDQVEPGKYEMELFICDPRHPVNWDLLGFLAETNFLAEYDGYDRTFEIPASEPNNREPLDLGVIEVSLKPQDAAVGPTGDQQTHQSNAASNHDAVEISGRVVDPSAHPVAGAQLALFKPHSDISLTGEPRLFNPVPSPHVMGEPRLENLLWNYCTTDAQGRFFLDDLDQTLFLLAAHEIGFARIATNDFSSNMTIKLEPWGRIEGTVWPGDKVLTNEAVHAVIGRYDGTPWSQNTKFETNTDNRGHFTFAFIPPGRFLVFASGLSAMARVQSGQTTVLKLAKLAGNGRAVVGKFKIRNPSVEIEWGRKGDLYYFGSAGSWPHKRFKTKEDLEAWRSQPEVENRIDNQHFYPVECAQDGSFHIDQVEPGKYEMTVALHDPRNLNNWIGGFDGSARTFDVPASSTTTGQPVDLGVVEISLNTQSTHQFPGPVREQIFTNTLALGFLFEPGDFVEGRPPSLVTDFIQSEFAVGDIYYMAGDGLFCVEMKLVELKASDWPDLNATQLAARLAAAPTEWKSPFDPDQHKDAKYGFQVYHDSEKIKYSAERPFFYGFQTRAGVIGLLQITSVSGPPPGIKMLYKLVQHVQRASP
jgi:beta-lactamase regulating signal transducer with metallopeptidase domain